MSRSYLDFKKINVPTEPIDIPEPMDIDDNELVNHHRRRQKYIEEKLLQCYAKEIAKIILKLVAENCNVRLPY